MAPINESENEDRECGNDVIDGDKQHQYKSNFTNTLNGTMMRVDSKSGEIEDAAYSTF